MDDAYPFTMDPYAVLARLTEDRSATAFFTDLSAAGPPYSGTALLGASPELLVARRGDMVKMEMSPYDLEKARITFRMKETNSNYTPPPRRRF